MHSSGVLLLSWSIFNPSGPTINCIGLKKTEARSELEVFYRWLHFLGGEDYCLGYVNPREGDYSEDLNEVLQHAFRLEAGDGLQRYALATSVPHVVVTAMEVLVDTETAGCSDEQPRDPAGRLGPRAVST